MMTLATGIGVCAAMALPSFASGNTLVECSNISNYGGHKNCYLLWAGTNTWQIKAKGTCGGGLNAAATPFSFIQAGGSSGSKGACIYSWSAVYSATSSANWVLVDPQWCVCSVTAAYQISKNP